MLNVNSEQNCFSEAYWSTAKKGKLQIKNEDKNMIDKENKTNNFTESLSLLPDALSSEYEFHYKGKNKKDEEHENKRYDIKIANNDNSNDVKANSSNTSHSHKKSVWQRVKHESYHSFHRHVRRKKLHLPNQTHNCHQSTKVKHSKEESDATTYKQSKDEIYSIGNQIINTRSSHTANMNELEARKPEKAGKESKHTNKKSKQNKKRDVKEDKKTKNNDSASSSHHINAAARFKRLVQEKLQAMLKVNAHSRKSHHDRSDHYTNQQRTNHKQTKEHHTNSLLALQDVNVYNNDLKLQVLETTNISMETAEGRDVGTSSNDISDGKIYQEQHDTVTNLNSNEDDKLTPWINSREDTLSPSSCKYMLDMEDCSMYISATLQRYITLIDLNLSKIGSSMEISDVSDNDGEWVNTPSFTSYESSSTSSLSPKIEELSHESHPRQQPLTSSLIQNNKKENITTTTTTTTAWFNLIDPYEQLLRQRCVIEKYILILTIITDCLQDCYDQERTTREAQTSLLPEWKLMKPHTIISEHVCTSNDKKEESEGNVSKACTSATTTNEIFTSEFCSARTTLVKHDHNPNKKITINKAEDKNNINNNANNNDEEEWTESSGYNYDNNNNNNNSNSISCNNSSINKWPLRRRGVGIRRRLRIQYEAYRNAVVQIAIRMVTFWVHKVNLCRAFEDAFADATQLYDAIELHTESTIAPSVNGKLIDHMLHLPSGCKDEGYYTYSARWQFLHSCNALQSAMRQHMEQIYHRLYSCWSRHFALREEMKCFDNLDIRTSRRLLRLAKVSVPLFRKLTTLPANTETTTQCNEECEATNQTQQYCPQSTLELQTSKSFTAFSHPTQISSMEENGIKSTNTYFDESNNENKDDNVNNKSHTENLENICNWNRCQSPALNSNDDDDNGNDNNSCNIVTDIKNNVTPEGGVLSCSYFSAAATPVHSALRHTNSDRATSLEREGRRVTFVLDEAKEQDKERKRSAQPRRWRRRFDSETNINEMNEINSHDEHYENNDDDDNDDLGIVDDLERMHAVGEYVQEVYSRQQLIAQVQSHTSSDNVLFCEDDKFAVNDNKRQLELGHCADEYDNKEENDNSDKQHEVNCCSINNNSDITQFGVKQVDVPVNVSCKARKHKKEKVLNDNKHHHHHHHSHQQQQHRRHVSTT